MEIKPPNCWESVPPGPNIPSVVHTIVEIPRGRRSKFEVDKETGLIRLDRYLYSSLHYPGDYGFIPQTLAEDGDAMDILVMVNEPTFSGCLIEARPIGLFKMTDKGVNDFKILAVPSSDPTFAEFHDLWRVPAHFLREVEHFFGTYKQLEEQSVETIGWEGAESARQQVLESIERYRKSTAESGRRKDDKPAAPAQPVPRPTKASTKPTAKKAPAKKKPTRSPGKRRSA